MNFFMTIAMVVVSVSACIHSTDEIPSLKDLFVEAQYKNYGRKNLEEIIAKMVNNNENMLQTWEHSYLIRDYKDLMGGNPVTKRKRHNTTALGLCIIEGAHSPSGSILADVLVNNGARLSRAYNSKFSAHFIKKIKFWYRAAHDVRAPATKLFEIVQYRRIQHCIQKSTYVYLIAQRLKNKALLPNISLVIPKYILDHIAHYIIEDGVTDVMNVCGEKFIEKDSVGEMPKQWTMFALWDYWITEPMYKEDLRWTPKDLRPFDPQVWRNDFAEFIKKKRSKEWDGKDSNLIMRALRYKTESLYKDEEFKLEPH